MCLKEYHIFFPFPMFNSCFGISGNEVVRFVADLPPEGWNRRIQNYLFVI